MKTKIITIAIILFTLFVTAWTVQTAQTKVFEYKYENRPLEEKANELGAQGWELVAIQGATDHNFNATYVFKREKRP
ncbi:MAG: hypothetical protein ACR2GD_06740 [Pyrinomonadaceae bacterium]